ncbi:methyl-accepting chemotaxis protein ['Paenibacillus yunnanensis' Narsing Rao et al. 2020]|uniref:methyl-accepting chemotaxis protein n=1 Tax=Paenibacillus tengchongensis TaxID=2608684 RepID=UPI00124EC1C8|nr:methyl-accepting chemotaxis protein [Paenibacillus tengchongensis]
MKIRMKLAVIMIAVTLLSTVIMGVFTYNKSTGTILELTETAMTDMNRGKADTIKAAISKEQRSMALVAQETEIIRLLQQEAEGEASGSSPLQAEVNAKLQQLVQEAGNLEHMFVVDMNGIGIADSDVKLVGTDFSERNYAKRVFETGKPVISETLKSKSTGAYVLAFVHPVTSGGEMIGFVASAVNADGMIDYLADAKVANAPSSYAYLVDETGNMLYHPDASKIGLPVENGQIQAVVKRVKAGEQIKPGNIEYMYNGSEKKAAYELIPETRWTLVLTGELDEVMAPVNDMTRYIILLGIGCLLLSLLIGLFVAQRISSPIIKLTGMINKTADLDLVYDPQYESLLKNKDETGTIARAMFHTRSVLRGMAESLVSISGKVLDNAQTLEKLSVEVRENAHDNSATAQQLSAGMEETAASAEEMTAAVQDIGSHVQIITEEAQAGMEASGGIAERALSLQDNASASTEQAKMIYEQVRTDMEQAIARSAAISDIHTLADTILSITSQTQLLALNAAIEAARAGEAGRGFAVVASEIRKLADQSSKTAAGIQDVVHNVYSSVEQMKENSEAMLNFIDHNVLSDYERLLEVSRQYHSDASTVNDLMLRFGSAAEHLSETVSAIGTAIHEVAATVNEGAVGVQDIAEKTADIVEKTFQEANMADENTQSATALQELVAKFKV